MRVRVKVRVSVRLTHGRQTSGRSASRRPGCAEICTPTLAPAPAAAQAKALAQPHRRVRCKSRGRPEPVLAPSAGCREAQRRGRGAAGVGLPNLAGAGRRRDDPRAVQVPEPGFPDIIRDGAAAWNCSLTALGVCWINVSPVAAEQIGRLGVCTELATCRPLYASAVSNCCVSVHIGHANVPSRLEASVGCAVRAPATVVPLQTRCMAMVVCHEMPPE